MIWDWTTLELHNDNFSEFLKRQGFWGRRILITFGLILKLLTKLLSSVGMWNADMAIFQSFLYKQLYLNSFYV